MHLGNGAITPECAALTFSAAAAGLGFGTYAARIKPALGESKQPEQSFRERLSLAVGLGGLVFAAQAVNVPILPASSAHLVGGVLLAAAVGPALGAWTMAVILTIQAFALGDGGVLALGANVLNMGLLPAALVAGWQRLSKGASRYPLVSISLVAAVAVPLAAGLILVETALFRSTAELAGWMNFAIQMLTTHLWIGLAEGAVTGALLLVVQQLAQRSTSRSWQPAVVSLAAALLLTAVVFPWASNLPDGYEAAAEQNGLASWLSEDTQSLAAAWQAASVTFIHDACGSEQALLIAATLLTAALTSIVVMLNERARAVRAIEN